MKAFENASKFTRWEFLKGVDVLADAADGAVVTFGDSITDGALSTYDTNSRWPDVLARRLHDDKKTCWAGRVERGHWGQPRAAR